MKARKTNPEIVIKLKGCFCIENWWTDELIQSFETNEERDEWLAANVNADGYTKDGIKVSLYESF